jgi:hypothetical protein
MPDGISELLLEDKAQVSSQERPDVPYTIFLCTSVSKTVYKICDTILLYFFVFLLCDVSTIPLVSGGYIATARLVGVSDPFGLPGASAILNLSLPSCL